MKTRRCLTESMVHQIRRMYFREGRTLRDIAGQLDLSPYTVSDVVCGRSWGFLPFQGPEPVPELVEDT